MNKLLGLLLVPLLAGSASLAEAAPRDGGRDGYARHGHYERNHYRGDHRPGYHRHDHRRHDRHAHHGGHHRPRPDHRHPHVHSVPVYVHPPGYRPYRWVSGHYLPRPYYAPVYYVDYRPYRLPPPPHGHHWVRVDRDVLLVALATGLIVDTVYDLFY